MAKLEREELRRFLFRKHCDCGCGRVADTVRGPIGWRARALPDDRTRWRALAMLCAGDEGQVRAA